MSTTEWVAWAALTTLNLGGLVGCGWMLRRNTDLLDQLRDQAAAADPDGAGAGEGL